MNFLPFSVPTGGVTTAASASLSFAVDVLVDVASRTVDFLLSFNRGKTQKMSSVVLSPLVFQRILPLANQATAMVTNHYYVFRHKFMAVAAMSSKSFATHCSQHIFPRSNWFQMLWVYAASIAAKVVKLQGATDNLSGCNKVGIPVGRNGFSLIMETTIPPIGTVPLPFPTGVGFQNLCPKPVLATRLRNTERASRPFLRKPVNEAPR